jgi:hypothetical protein
VVRAAAPRGDRQDFAHKAADHRQKTRQQHHGKDDNVEKRYRHRMVRSAFNVNMAIGSRDPRIADGHIARPARVGNPQKPGINGKTASQPSIVYWIARCG